VESIARVKKLSLSGKILYLSRMADLLFVQWPELQELHPRSVYAGRLY
jgi:beta-1,4-N-acetylglucosaminyltransferase